MNARARLVGTAGLVGALAGTAGIAAGLAWFGDPATATRKTFAVGALFLAVGLLGWSGSVFAGDGFEAVQRHLDTGSSWSGADSRRAMTRVGSFGAGWMVGSSVAGWLLRAALGP